MIFGIVLLVLILAVVFWVISIYNGLITLKNQVANSWKQIDVQLKRRYDLIPNLVETVKGYMAYEKEVLQKVVEARASAMKASTPAEKGVAEGILGGALANLFAVAEAYPDLKANQNMLQLQEELTSTENKIAFSRQFYNDLVMRYNTAQQVFPTNVIVGMFAGLFKIEEYFNIPETEKEVVKVKF